MTTSLRVFLTILIALFATAEQSVYPIDGYEETGINRLLRLQRIVNGEIDAPKPPPGAQKSITDIRLHLTDARGDSLSGLPEPDPQLQKSVRDIFPTLDESYSITLLDITPGRTIKYAQLKEKRGYQPGSVGKLAVLAALFNELDTVFPNSFAKKQELLRTKKVMAGSWGGYDEHEIPVYDPETGTFENRRVKESDVFSLYEWTDHMLSVSNNGAASVVWRESILMRVYGKEYPQLTEEEANRYFKTTPKKELSKIAMAIVNEPLREIGIGNEEWRLGRLFTSGASQIIPPSGGSIGTPLGLMKFLIAIEKGEFVDEKSSLEMKRLMYMTDRRIRYAASPALTDAAVYFKSGSLYKCQQEEGFKCGKYMGNVYNYMNSVSIVEQPDGRVYLVCLMSNVLKKNSASDHFTLASRIDKLIKSNS
ncbi:serine hydrolase [Balneolaceae bacterium YR4-1]|uniref:Serine hydrolase n=1 Tax=Halalkalibaculum roseum TaxID=2709311 RepID=A0A6M1SZJ5_9BACT|nr:serine hydrolase [Halalkalibaculum roseum]NGP75295.1 serine hydrolase [Halalkalibaculum roseum]